MKTFIKFLWIKIQIYFYSALLKVEKLYNEYKYKKLYYFVRNQVLASYGYHIDAMKALCELTQR